MQTPPHELELEQEEEQVPNDFESPLGRGPGARLDGEEESLVVMSSAAKSGAAGGGGDFSSNGDGDDSSRSTGDGVSNSRSRFWKPPHTTPAPLSTTWACDVARREA